MSRYRRYSKVFILAIVAVMVFSVSAFAQDKVVPEKGQDDSETVLAKVGDTEIKVKDVDSVISQLPPQQAFMFSTDSGRERILTELVNKELFYLWGEEQGIADRDDFKTDLESIRRNLMSHYAMQDIMQDVSVDSDDVAEYYGKHKDEFVESEQVRASHILVDSEDQAIEILSLLEANKKTFEEAAKEFSKCPSKERGGDLGFFSRGQMVKAFEDAAFTLKLGELSEPVKTEYGWHIIKIEDKKPQRQKELSEVSDQIREKLLNERQMKRYDETVETLKLKHHVEIMERVPEPTSNDVKDADGNKQDLSN